MHREQLKKTLNSLHQALAGESDIDPELQNLLATLDDDIHELLAQESMVDEATITAAEVVAARFAIDHPRMEAIVRELVAALAKMGV